MSLKQKTEGAFLGVLESAGIGSSNNDDSSPFPKLYKSQESQKTTRKVPCVSAEMMSARQTTPKSGVYEARVVVMVLSTADEEVDAGTTTPEEHELLCKQVFHELSRDDLQTALSNAVADFHCLQAIRRGPMDQEAIERMFADAWLFDVFVCESDMT